MGHQRFVAAVMAALILCVALPSLAFGQSENAAKSNVETAGDDSLERFVLQDGMEYVGVVTEDSADHIRLRLDQSYGQRTITIWKDEIASRSFALSAAVEKNGAEESPKEKAVEPENTARLFVIPLRGLIGHDATQECVKLAIESVDLNEVDAIVITMNCAGGHIPALEEIHQYLLTIERNHRVVMWIRLAWGSSPVLALGHAERYMESDGHMAFRDAPFQYWYQPDPDKGAEKFAKWCAWAVQEMRNAGIDPLVAEAVLKCQTILSVDGLKQEDPQSSVLCHADLSGEYILSRKGEYLELSAALTEALHISRGSADTLEELSVLLGYDGYEEVSKAGLEIANAWQALVKQADRDVRRLYQELYLIKDVETIEDRHERIHTYRRLMRYAEMLGPEVAKVFYGLERKTIMEAIEQETEKKQ
ncbi:MAG: hypothetical protein D8M59_15565 [Planctomycetes bacterium]|nr:hypothetical protein [Planctomycetota bacterium]NOG55551.1 hypothetical protein [Planctomycetota bacterium]